MKKIKHSRSLKRFLLLLISAGTLSSCKIKNRLEQAETKGSALPRKPIVLMYHDVVELKEGKGIESLESSDTTPTALQEQLDFLKSDGYKIIGTRELFEARLKKLKIPEKSVLLTFDDGYLGNYKYALPILRNRDLKATFFIHTNFVGVGPDDGTVALSDQDKSKRIKNCSDNRKSTSRDHMDWDHLREISADNRFEVYSHTHNHIRLTDEIEENSGTQLAKPNELYQIQMELGCSRRLLEEKLGGDRPFLAYPFGAHNLKIIEAAKPIYNMAFIVSSALKVHDVGYQLPRLDVGKNSLKLSAFKCRLRAWSAGDQLSSCS